MGSSDVDLEEPPRLPDAATVATTYGVLDAEEVTHDLNSRVSTGKVTDLERDLLRFGVDPHNENRLGIKINVEKELVRAPSQEHLGRLVGFVIGEKTYRLATDDQGFFVYTDGVNPITRLGNTPEEARKGLDEITRGGTLPINGYIFA